MLCHRYTSVDSTNAVAIQRITEASATEAFCVLAEGQTAGRGSRGRKWCSPAGAGLYLTLAEPCAGLTAHSPAAWTEATGVACVDVLRHATRLPVRLRAINDLYVGHAKLGGILSEARVDTSGADWLISGVGINVLRARRTLVNAAAPAVCLEQLLRPRCLAALCMDRLRCELVAAMVLRHAQVSAGRAAHVHRAAHLRRQCNAFF